MDNRNFKENVKTAAAYLAEHGVAVSHSRLLEAMSRAFGERNWSTLSAQLKAGEEPQAAPTPEWDPSQGPMTEAQYVAFGGNRCPFCGSDNIEADGPEADGPRTWDNNTCHGCGSTWSGAYSLSGYFDACRADGAPTVKVGEDVQRFLDQLTDTCVVILCSLSDDEAEWLGYVYPAKAAISALAMTLVPQTRAELRTPQALLGTVLEDESNAVDELIMAQVRPLAIFSKFDEPSAREAARDFARQMVVLEPMREDVVQDLVDDVKERADRYAFSYSGWDNALRLARESSEVMEMDATEQELAEAATRLS